MKNYWFVEYNSGEEFFVQEETKEKAWEIARSLDFGLNEGETPDLKCIDVLDDWQAEWVGLDTY